MTWLHYLKDCAEINKMLNDKPLETPFPVPWGAGLRTLAQRGYNQATLTGEPTGSGAICFSGTTGTRGKEISP
jgi:hypothetical protein